MFGSECCLKMHARNLGYFLPLKTGAQSDFFQQLHSLMAILMAYIFRTKHDTHNRASALTTIRVLLHPVKMSWMLIHKRLKTATTTTTTSRIIVRPPNIHDGGLGFFFLSFFYFSSATRGARVVCSYCTVVRWKTCDSGHFKWQCGHTTLSRKMSF